MFHYSQRISGIGGEQTHSVQARDSEYSYSFINLQGSYSFGYFIIILGVFQLGTYCLLGMITEIAVS